MSILSRLRALRSPDAACARALFAGQGLPPGAPARQQALAGVLEAAAGPGTAHELAGEVAAAAAFVQVTSQLKPRRTARRVLVAAACAMAAAGTAVYAIVVPSPHHNTVPLPYGVPHHMVQAPAVTSIPPRLPERWQAHPNGQATDRKARHATGPDVPQPSRGRLQAGGMPASFPPCEPASRHGAVARLIARHPAGSACRATASSRLRAA
jgi:hypothetical protein